MSTAIVPETPVSLRDKYLSADKASRQVIARAGDPFTPADPKFEELVDANSRHGFTREQLVSLPDNILGALYQRSVFTPAGSEVLWPGEAPDWNVESLEIESTVGDNPIVDFASVTRSSQTKDAAQANVAQQAQLHLDTDIVTIEEPEIRVWIGQGDMSVLHSAAEARQAALVLLQVAEDFDRIVGEAPKVPGSDIWHGIPDLIDPNEKTVTFQGPTITDTSAGGEINARISYDLDRADEQHPKAFFADIIVQHPPGSLPLTSALEDLSIDQFRKMLAAGLAVAIEYDALPAVTA